MRKGLIVYVMVISSIVGFVVGCKRFVNYLPLEEDPTLIKGASYVGYTSCIPCHDDVFMNFKNNIHNRLARFETPQKQKGCEACHGPGSLHVNEKGEGPIVNFSKLSSDKASLVCISCHRGGATMEWTEGEHLINGVGCNECHRIHQKDSKKLLCSPEPRLCYSCHPEKKAQFTYPSHHPVKEGKLKCTNCHNIHGPKPHDLWAESTNDLCFDCHTDKQGPFIYEHPPAVEDCTICHEPHGTVANNLLRQNQPFLCLRCHRGHRRNPMTGTHPTVAVFLTSCTQCHSQIHGSDLPSQVEGKGLTR